MKRRANKPVAKAKKPTRRKTALVLSFETLGAEEGEKHCSYDGRFGHKCNGPNQGRILAGQRHMVLRHGRGGTIDARFCDHTCYDANSNAEANRAQDEDS